MDILTEQNKILNNIKASTKPLLNDKDTIVAGTQIMTNVIKLEALVSKSKRAFEIVRLNVTKVDSAVM